MQPALLYSTRLYSVIYIDISITLLNKLNFKKKPKTNQLNTANAGEENNEHGILKRRTVGAPGWVHSLSVAGLMFSKDSSLQGDWESPWLCALERGAPTNYLYL